MRQASDFVEMIIPAQPEYVGIVRLTASGVSNRMGYTYDDIEDIKVAVSEACTNAVNHAYQQDENGKITVGFGVFSDRLEIMVVDRGQSFDFDKVYQDLGPINEETSVDQMSEGGLGLFLIETLMDKVEFSGDAGVVVMMTKYLQGGGVKNNAGTISAQQEQ